MSCFIQHALPTEKRDLRQPCSIWKDFICPFEKPPPLKGTQAYCVMSKWRTEFCIFELLLLSHQQCIGRLHSFPFSLPLRFWLLAISEASSNIKIKASRLTSLEFWLVCNIWLTYWIGETGDSCFMLACLPFGRVMILASVFLKCCAIWRQNWEFSKGPPSSLSKLFSTIHLTLWLGSSAHRQKQQ